MAEKLATCDDHNKPADGCHNCRIIGSLWGKLTEARQERDALAAQVAALVSFTEGLIELYQDEQRFMVLKANIPAAARYLAADRVAQSYFDWGYSPSNLASAGMAIPSAMFDDWTAWRKACEGGGV
jgi:hypothetical protein